MAPSEQYTRGATEQSLHWAIVTNQVPLNSSLVLKRIGTIVMSAASVNYATVTWDAGGLLDATYVFELSFTLQGNCSHYRVYINGTLNRTIPAIQTVIVPNLTLGGVYQIHPAECEGAADARI